MADLVNSTVDVPTRVQVLGSLPSVAAGSAVGVSTAQTLDASLYRTFHITLAANGIALTVANVYVGSQRQELELILRQDATGTRLKPTLAGTNTAGTALVFKTWGSGAATGGVLPLLTTTIGAIDRIRFVSVDGVVFYQSELALAAIT